MANMILRALVALAMMTVAATCSPTCNPSPSTGQAKVHLVFIGPAQGTLTTADVACHLFNNKTEFNALISGKLDGKDLTMNVQVRTGYHGPDTYLIGTTLDGAANVRLQVGDFVGSSPPTAGKLIMTDEKSGVVDSNLGGFESVTGSFTCAEVKTE